MSQTPPTSLIPAGNVIGEDGLRYVKKVTVQPSGNPASFAATTATCLYCSTRKPRSLMRFIQIAGTRSFVCAESCR